MYKGFCWDETRLGHKPCVKREAGVKLAQCALKHAWKLAQTMREVPVALAVGHTPPRYSLKSAGYLRR